MTRESGDASVLLGVQPKGQKKDMKCDAVCVCVCVRGAEGRALADVSWWWRRALGSWVTSGSREGVSG